MHWYIPSWNGDLRLEARDEQTKLSIVRPTDFEVKVLGQMKTQFIEKDWIKEEDWQNPSRWRKRTVVINAPLAEVGALAQKLMKPGGAVMTAVVMAGGEVTTHCRAMDEAEDTEQVTETVKKAEKDGAKAATTVKRATPCCPQCVPGSIGPANEVLQAFLTPEQHETWAEDRTILVEGGITGINYMLAHRHSETARRIGRICYDLDNDSVVHFHDYTVPPEEEVLGAMLVLQHAEPWLRNEATMYDRRPGGTDIFKNPFGDMSDGVEDSRITAAIGNFAAAGGFS
jgi:hypothetical protein